MRLSVIGLGKLGAPLAAVFAARGHDVVGVDLSEAAVQAINEGRAPVSEPRLQEMIDDAGGRLRATLDIAEAVAASEMTFVLVPTPSGPDGTFVLDHVLPAVEAIGKALATKWVDEPDVRHVVVITSTVMPGSTDGPIRQALEAASGLRVGGEVGLCYSPEFIALGTVVRDLLNPDLILVGESDPDAGTRLGDLLSDVVSTDPPVQRMGLVNAELAKISVNTYVTTKISYANMLAEMCEQLPGADVEVVTQAIGLDTRIGSKYLRGAMAYGGPCFPRDNVAFAQLARSVGTRADIAEATDSVNRRQVTRIVDRIASALAPGANVAVLGLAYKPDTPVVDESPGVAVADALAAAGFHVTVFDPLANESARRVLGDRVTYHDDARRAIRGCDAVVLATPWPELRELDFDRAGDQSPLFVVDCWRMIDASRSAADVVQIGVGPAPQG